MVDDLDALSDRVVLGLTKIDVCAYANEIELRAGCHLMDDLRYGGPAVSKGRHSATAEVRWGDARWEVAAGLPGGVPNEAEVDDPDLDPSTADACCLPCARV